MSDQAASAPTRLWLIRHGETEWNLIGRYQGQTDIPLNEAGLAQAQALLPIFADLPIAAIYSSDLQRAATTAGILGAALGLPVTTDPALREVRLGAWEGMLFVDIPQQYPEDWEARRRDPVNALPPGGESLGQVALRVTAAADRIARAHPGEQVVIVAHGLVLAAMRCLAKGLPLGEAYSQVPDNCRPEPVDWSV
jgi:alpha-ribazole phosphatase